MKTKTAVLLMIVGALTLATLACSFTINLPDLEKGNGNVSEETRDISGFSEITFSGIGELTVTLGDEPALSIEAEENLLPYIETYTRGNTLVIEIEDGINIQPTEPVRFAITAVSLESVEVSGVGDVNLPDLEADRFDISISGVGDVEISSLTAERLTADMSGLGDLTIRDGEVDSQQVEISGGGKYTASNMQSAEAKITISGVGTATLRVEDFLDVSISGSGNVSYYGSPQVTSDISGIGDLDHLDD